MVSRMRLSWSGSALPNPPCGDGYKEEGRVETHPQRLTEARRRAQQRGAAAVRAHYLARTHAIIEEAKRAVGQISTRELWLVGGALYWAEGTKQKPHNVAQRATFSNSDPAMVCVFLRWLREVCQVPNERLTFELYIHESAQIERAKCFWTTVLQVPIERLRVRLKRHRHTPHRRNVGDSYVGLIRLTVLQGATLNRSIKGWRDGLVEGLGGESANGKPSDFGSEYPGSIPGSPVPNGELSGQQHNMVRIT